MHKLTLFLISFLLFTRVAYSQSDSTLVQANQFFNSFISGDMAKAYPYFDKEFQSKVSIEKIKSLQEQFLTSYGSFNSIIKASTYTQKNINYVLLTVAFDRAKPVFALTLNDQNKIAGLFITAENYIIKYTDPLYVKKDSYIEENIFIETGDFKLPGLLTKPKVGANYPVVVLIHGSGPQNMDEQTGNLKPFRDLALGLAAKGIATVRYDKRTRIYGSKSVADGKNVGVKEEVIDDASSAILFASKLNNSKLKKVVLLGHSLGAQLAPEIALNNELLSGIVMLAAPARPIGEMLNEQFRYLVKDSVALAANLKLAGQIAHADTIKNQNKLLMGANASYFTDLNKRNQVSTAKKLKLPMLILQGERDYQVTLTDLNIWKKAIGKSKNVVIKSYPKLNHSFTEGEGKLSNPAEYNIPANIPEYVIIDISNFIHNNL
ncbi:MULTISPECIES: alpha/beta fold hydrolase [Pedobacter]|uniref:alpha/beta hydrolase n=1 Tax=Pedobacter TaxID=84567 RepID=UPI001E459D99|nr:MULTISPECIES: alpha/beta fold hydrolase [Pedobacter]